MNKTTRYAIVFGIIAILVALFVWYKATPGQYDKLATCLRDEGVTFFGAFWCPHCQAAKQAFGKSAKYLNYVECSTPDGASQNQICKDARIPGYPTWEFSKTIVTEKFASDISFLCSSEEGLAVDDCQNSAEGTWYTQAGSQKFLSPSKPTFDDKNWTFPAKSRAIATTDPLKLASFASCSVN